MAPTAIGTRFGRASRREYVCQPQSSRIRIWTQGRARRRVGKSGLGTRSRARGTTLMLESAGGKPLHRLNLPTHGGRKTARRGHMLESAIAKNDFPLEASIPHGAVSLESILCTEELRRRPWRPPDYEKENRALVALAGALVESPFNILQTLAETILDVTQCDSSGLSLLTKDDGGKRFYWPAIAGEWKRNISGGSARGFGPCGDVLDQNRTLLFRHFERRYPYFIPITPAVEECLLVPFYIGGKAVGTIWAITHGDRRKFDSEDERI